MKTLNYDYFFHADHDPALTNWLWALTDQIDQQSAPARHGHLPKWLDALHSLPERQSTIANNLTTDIIEAGNDNTQDKQAIRDALLTLSPWRKGPFKVDSIFINSEWRSNLKWNRIADKITPLKNRTVLDVGCGNGYYGYRMLGDGARTVVGVDPGELFCTQFLAINHFFKESQLAVLPLTGEMIFEKPYPFDSVFSMGVLSHRREPEEHLAGLYSCVRSGGELILETLVIDVPDKELLIPEDRYANMRNIWKLPSIPALIEMVQQAGFINPRCVDVCRTTAEEQRPTEWMSAHSLQQGLNPDNPSETVEGYPAPTRAVVIAERP